MNRTRTTARRRSPVGWIVLGLVVVGAMGFVSYRILFGGLSGPETEFEESPAVAVEQRDPEPVTPPLDFSGFAAGNIISDEAFYDSSTMDQAAIESFLAGANDGCREGLDGTPCITAYVEDSPSFDANDYCYAFEGAAGDTTATIIAKAATSCGINPQVLLVMLQKEQGLLTASGARLNEGRYTIAMGYGCPDSAHCAPEFSGFANQVYHAARQLRMYANDPAKYVVQPFVVADVALHPNADCGSAPVQIENYATAGLYNYTPYQPDQAALDGLHGSCSSSGNLNFYAYFNAWFG